MAPPSPARMGELMRASARLGPGGTVTRWEPLPSLPFRAVMNAVSFSVLASWDRGKTTGFGNAGGGWDYRRVGVRGKGWGGWGLEGLRRWERALGTRNANGEELGKEIKDGKGLGSREKLGIGCQGKVGNWDFLGIWCWGKERDLGMWEFPPRMWEFLEFSPPPQS